jgi:pyridoxamine 5'-phosphate oxidase
MPSPHKPHLPDQLPAEPLELVSAWLAEAATSSIAIPEAMVLATVDARGSPSARVVLCKEVCVRPGYITFFTNYLSRKGLELAATARAAAVIYWDALHRQIRLEGPVTRASAAESDAYFASRPWQARLGAWASAQSSALASRAELAESVDAAARRFGAPSPLASSDDAPDPGVPIPRPPHWGGYHLWVDAAELWMEGAARLHDRARWQRHLTPSPSGFEPGPWSAQRLHP